MSYLGFFCHIKTPNNTKTRSNLGRRGFILVYNYPLIFCHWEQSGQELKVRTWRWELKQKPWRNAAYQLPPHILLSLLSYTVKSHLSRTGSTHSAVGPPTSITKQEVKQICLMKEFIKLSMESPPSKWLLLLSCWHKTHHDSMTAGVVNVQVSSGRSYFWDLMGAIFAVIYRIHYLEAAIPSWSSGPDNPLRPSSVIFPEP